MERYDEELLFDETPEQAERAIVKGLHYLEREARTAKLGHLAEAIKQALLTYLSMIRGESDENRWDRLE